MDGRTGTYYYLQEEEEEVPRNLRVLPSLVYKHPTTSQAASGPTPAFFSLLGRNNVA